ncbi:hypothetical protein E1211_26430 [Micromonospora sp. 15K316]|uniref:hypothetical protein n=1 Tax=Micromonospora sp. 15K316 TaxID=2530376 RepID=UPI00104913A2|nr:hypothetical protein [Micromonospora sp. 15K316]TDC29202.1 hypothetical protein E1211_26430 [Micromonospora sp. 15K316]
MGYRRRDARPRVALWMLVAFGDAVLLLVGLGIPALVALVSVVAVTVAGVGAWLVARRGVQVQEDALPARVGVPVRHRRRI